MLCCYFVQSFFVALPGIAVTLPIVSNKRAQMLLPAYEKLFQGAGPATNDSEGKSTSQSGGASEGAASNSNSSDLSPLTLTDSAQNNSKEDNQGSADTANGAVLKSTVSTTDYLPHKGDPTVLQARSIKKDHGKKGKADKGSLSEQAAAVKVGPLPLLETDGETLKKVGTVLDAEKEQLADLWESTLTRSPQIQFIVQKLQPTSNPAHLTNILARMLSTMAFGGLGAMSMMSPSMGTFAAASMGGSMVQTALGITQSRSDKKAKLTQEEEIMMLNIVCTTCDKLVGSYRDYKKYSNALTRGANDLQDLQSMVAEARSGQDSAKQLEMEYTLRKQQRDLDSIADDSRRDRQSLVDLAGPEAVDKLDKQLADERGRLEQVAGDPAAAQQAQTPTEEANANQPAAQPQTQVNSNVASETEDSGSALSPEKRKTQTASTLSPQS